MSNFSSSHLSGALPGATRGAPSSATRAKRGFTLIELLVVIAIIAILASILFPVFGRARENARKSSCLSNLKQVGLGIMQYSQDYDECYPLYTLNPATAKATSANDTNPNGIYGWADAIQPYVKSEQVYQCPSEPTSAPKDATPQLRARSTGYVDYVYNCTLSRPDTGPPKGVTQATLQATSLTVMLVDANPNPDRSRTPMPSAYQLGTARQATRGSQGFAALATDPGIAANRHLEGANLLFCDGHVKWQKAGGTENFANVWNANTPFSTSGQNPTFHPYDGVSFPAPDA